MNSLITKSLEDIDLSHLILFPKELMSDVEKEMVEWIMGFYSKYEETPSLSRLKTEFPHFVPFSEGEAPIGDVFDRAKKRRIIRGLRYKLNAVLEKLDEGDIPEDDIREAAGLVTLSGGVDRLTTFDRSKYVRGERLNLGFALIDRAIGGISAGELLVISGRLGTGKSTISQKICFDWWMAGKRILYVSNEMLPTDVFSRIDGFVGHFNPRIFRDAEEIAKVKSAIDVVKSKVLEPGRGEVFIPRLTNRTPSTLFTVAKDFGVDVVIVDGFYLMKPDGGGYVKNHERVQILSNQLKQEAMNAKLPIVTVTQIKRDAAGRKETLYDVEDLAFSDAIGQDADFVLAIKPDEIEPERIALQLIKNRFGPTAAQYTRVDFDTMEFVDLSDKLDMIEPILGSDGEVKSLW